MVWYHNYTAWWIMIMHGSFPVVSKFWNQYAYSRITKNGNLLFWDIDGPWVSSWFPLLGRVLPSLHPLDPWKNRQLIWNTTKFNQDHLTLKEAFLINVLEGIIPPTNRRPEKFLRISCIAKRKKAKIRYKAPFHPAIKVKKLLYAEWSSKIGSYP
jgi:hypothetical protein